MNDNSEKQTAADKRVSDQEKIIWHMHPNDPDLPAARRLLARLRELASKVPRVLDLRRNTKR